MTAEELGQVMHVDSDLNVLALALLCGALLLGLLCMHAGFTPNGAVLVNALVLHLGVARSRKNVLATTMGVSILKIRSP